MKLLTKALLIFSITLSIIEIFLIYPVDKELSSSSYDNNAVVISIYIVSIIAYSVIIKFYNQWTSIIVHSILLIFGFVNVITGLINCINQSNWLRNIENNLGCLYESSSNSIAYTGKSGYYDFTERFCSALVSSSSSNKSGTLCFCSQYDFTNYDTVGICSVYDVHESCNYFLEVKPQVIKASIWFSSLVLCSSVVLYVISCYEIWSMKESLITDKIPVKAYVESVLSPIINIDTNDNTQIKKIMWSMDLVGLFAHYALVGFINGSVGGLSSNFCFYYFNGPSNLCANAGSIITIPWNLKFLYAIVTDSYRPLGLRRKPYIILGWSVVLILTLVLAFISESIQNTDSGVYIWIGLSFLVQGFLILADVPADGMCVEIGKYEAISERGVVLITGQLTRFAFAIAAGVLQALFMNGPSTNSPTCPINLSNCWSWGMTVSGFYGISTVLIFFLLIPIIAMKEINPNVIPHHDFMSHVALFWTTLKNRTTLYLLIYTCFGFTFGAMSSIASVIFMYDVIKVTNLQIGVLTLLSYLALFGGIIVFRYYLMNKNWRITQYSSFLIGAGLGLLLIPSYYDIHNLANAWFLTVITCLSSFAAGFSQTLYGLATIEVANKGQEAMTFELIVSGHNSAQTISSIIATQLLSFTNAKEVSVGSLESFQQSGGPKSFTNYTWIIFVINIIGTLTFTTFLPKQKDQCQEWKVQGEMSTSFPSNRVSGYLSIAISSVVLIYGILGAIILLDPSLSCLSAFGGPGC